MSVGAVAAVLALTQPVATCPLERAIYSDTAVGQFELQFGESGDERVLTLSSSRTDTRYRFSLNMGDGYSTTLLGPLGATEQSASTPEVAIYAITQNLDASGDFPSSASPAPLYMFAPELGRLLWYQAESLEGPSMASGVRERLPRTFFKLSRCRE